MRNWPVITLTSLSLAVLMVKPAAAQMAEKIVVQDIPVAAPSQDYCISVMSAFPNGDSVARYQFFKLTEKMAVGATPE